MISFEEARQIVLENVPASMETTLPLREAIGCVLARDTFAPLDSPSFDSSAMDGFAIRHEEAPGLFKKAGLIAAGDGISRTIQTQACFEIMTGAKIPQGATAVVPYEEAESRGEEVEIPRPVRTGENIRRRGEQFKEGGLVLPRGTPLAAGAIGLLASLGFSEVRLFAPPKIFIIPTGSELVLSSSMEGGRGECVRLCRRRGGPAAPLSGDKIFESNGLTLQAALKDLPVSAEISDPIPDLPKVLSAVLEAALSRSDIVCITGGVSVGKHDCVKPLLEKLKVKTLFWGVAQKPGKPLYFGKLKKTLVFGLPGNPASTLVCFYEYVRPAILKWMGFASPGLKEERGFLTKAFVKKEGRIHFVRARAERKNGRWSVTPLEGQDSHLMKSFALANCLMVAPSKAAHLEEGKEVVFQWLP